MPSLSAPVKHTAGWASSSQRLYQIPFGNSWRRGGSASRCDSSSHDITHASACTGHRLGGPHFAHRMRLLQTGEGVHRVCRSRTHHTSAACRESVCAGALVAHTSIFSSVAASETVMPMRARPIVANLSAVSCQLSALLSALSSQTLSAVSCQSVSLMSDHQHWSNSKSRIEL